MTWMATTLWDMLAPKRRRISNDNDGEQHVATGRSNGRPRPQRNPPNGLAASHLGAPARPSVATMQQRYDALVVEMKEKYSVRVRKWRKSSSGVAWMIRYRDGRQVKLIESPYPRGPMSCAIFLHEIGHHAIGLGVHRPRCLEEYHVWAWALREMRERGFNVTPAVEKRVHDSMKYAVGKAKRRGLQSLPEQLRAYA